MASSTYPMWRTDPVEPETWIEMAAFEAEFDSDNPADAPDAVLHLFYGLVQAIDQLGAIEVRADLESQIDWLPAFYASPVEFWQEMAEVPDVLFHHWLEKIAAFDKLAGRTLSRWFWQHSLPAVELWVYMPCHTEWARLTFNTETLTASIHVE